jgi:RNA polymerase sigma-70 factor, ECF subfamily
VVDPQVQFEEMYRAHGAAVRGFVHRRVRAAVADDVVADVFAIAWRRMQDAPTDELSWLLGIARGVLANRRRSEARQNALQDRLAASAVVTAVPESEVFDGGSVVMRALGSLNRLDQEVLLLVAWDGLDRAQAGAVLGITPGLFSVRLHRARRRLKRALAAQQDAYERQAEDRSTVEAFQ